MYVCMNIKIFVFHKLKPCLEYYFSLKLVILTHIFGTVQHRNFSKPRL